MKLCCASSDNSVTNGAVSQLRGVIVLMLATLIDSPTASLLLLQYCAALSLKKFQVSVVSAREVY